MLVDHDLQRHALPIWPFVTNLEVKLWGLVGTHCKQTRFTILSMMAAAVRLFAHLYSVLHVLVREEDKLDLQRHIEGLLQLKQVLLPGAWSLQVQDGTTFVHLGARR